MSPEGSKKEKDPGPKDELDYWRQRMQKITGWSENLKNKDFNFIKNHLSSKKQ